MLAKPTLLVLGAGSSLDFGLPAGPGLAAQIQHELAFEFDHGTQTSGSRAIIQTMLRARRDQTDALAEQGRVISKALSAYKSIDDCLHSHKANSLGVLAGKMAIAELIAEAEKRSELVSPLWGRDREARQAAKVPLWKTWAGQFVSMLVTGVPRENYADVLRQLTVVSFNYDRCFTSIVFHLLQDALDLDEVQAAKALSGMTVLHPYGRLGPLPVESGRGSVPFGSSGDLLEAANRLFLYTEQRDEPEYLESIRATTYAAERLLFLGFGFHDQNIRLMASPSLPLRGKEVFGTVYDVPQPALAAYIERISQHLGVSGPVRLDAMKCDALLAHYGALLGG